MCEGHRDARPSPRSAWRNLTESDAPLPRRLQQVVANTLWKVRRREPCCGHYGDPGC